MLDNIIKKEKLCKKCNLLKELHFFSKHALTKDGHRNICNSCKKIEHHNHYIKNKSKYFKNNKIWKLKNPQKMKSYYKKSYEKRKEYLKNYKITHRKESAFNQKQRRKNISYNMASILRHRIYMALKSKNIQKTNKMLNLLGCDIEQFRLHLQSQFQEGMTWENYGKWHIDHIKPCSSFDLSKENEQQLCFHYTNMQPLWAIDNLRKWKNY